MVAAAEMMAGESVVDVLVERAEGVAEGLAGCGGNGRTHSMEAEPTTIEPIPFLYHIFERENLSFFVSRFGFVL